MTEQPHAEIPYDEIDVEIRPLVGLLNRIPGIRTEFSCAGHGEGDEGYVSFRADSRDALSAILRILPSPPGMVASMDTAPFRERFSWSAAYILVDFWEDAPRYHLSIRGSPLYAQRQLIDALEKALRALDA